MAQNRLAGISGHLSSGYAGGLLRDEVAIVTGAAQGIGRAVALTFAREGAKVVVSDLDAKKAQQVVDEILQAGGDAIAVGGDVTSAEFPKAVVDAAIGKYGKINHIINNAGFTWDKMLHTMTDETFELMLKVHNVAPFRLIREAAPYLRSKDPKVQATNRSIVNVSSIAGLHGNVGQTNYATAKAGVLGLTKTIAKEWGAFNVRCNTVAFGYIETRLTGAKELGEAIVVNGKKVALGIPGGGGGKGAGPIPGIALGRPGTAQEAANGVLFLCSPLASYVTGFTLDVTGGNMILIGDAVSSGTASHAKAGFDGAVADQGSHARLQPTTSTHQVVQPAILYAGTPVALVTTTNPDGTTNVGPVSSAWWVGDRCMLGLGVGSQTTINLVRTKECVINLPDDKAAPNINRLHQTTGAEKVPPFKEALGYRFVKDKLSLLGFTPVPSDLVNPPRLAECPIAMEAEVVETHGMMQDNPTFSNIFLSFELRIGRVFAHPQILVDGHPNRIDPDRWRPLITSFQQFYGLSDRVSDSRPAEIDEEAYRMTPVVASKDL